MCLHLQVNQLAELCSCPSGTQITQDGILGIRAWYKELELLTLKEKGNCHSLENVGTYFSLFPLLSTTRTPNIIHKVNIRRLWAEERQRQISEGLGDLRKYMTLSSLGVLFASEIPDLDLKKAGSPTTKAQQNPALSSQEMKQGTS